MEDKSISYPYIKITNNENKIKQKNPNNISIYKNIKKSFAKRKSILRRPKLNSFLKKASVNNLSSDSLMNKNFSYYKDKFLKNINNDTKEDYNKINISKNSENKKPKINNSDAFLSSDALVKNFLEQNIKKNISFKYLSKYLKPLPINQKSSKGKNVFTLKKRIIFEKDIYRISLYVNFNNYKESNLYIGNKLDLNQNNTSYINNTKISNEGFPLLKKITNLDKALIKDGQRESNGNILYKDDEEEKKETVINIINSDNSYELIKKKLTKSKSDEKEKSDEEKEKQHNKIEDNKYLKKIILKNRLKNRDNSDLKIFDTYEQKNKKILGVINQNFKNKNRIRNNSLEENLKMINKKNELFFRKRKLNEISNKMNAFSHKLHYLNNKLNSCLESTKDVFNKDIVNIFN